MKREKLIEIDRDPLDCADLLAADVLPNCDNFSVLNGTCEQTFFVPISSLIMFSKIRFPGH